MCKVNSISGSSKTQPISYSWLPLLLLGPQAINSRYFVGTDKLKYVAMVMRAHRYENVMSRFFFIKALDCSTNWFVLIRSIIQKKPSYAKY